MKLSIIIVSYNEKQYIEECIQSCVNQKEMNDYEIILGDDGSNDGSIEMIKDYCTNKYPEIMNYFVMDRGDVSDVIPSLRVSNLLKRAFEMSKGQYIVIMSADDINVSENRLSLQIKCLEENLKYVACYCDYEKFWDNGKKRSGRVKAYSDSSLLWSSCYIHISCFVFRRCCLNNLLDRFCDDTGMFYSILKTGDVKYVPVLGFGYRQRSSSIMHKSDSIQNNLMELLLLQDCLNDGSFRKGSFLRFYISVFIVFFGKIRLNKKEYSKYIIESAKYDNDIIGDIISSSGLDNVKFFLFHFAEFHYLSIVYRNFSSKK